MLTVLVGPAGVAGVAAFVVVSSVVSGTMDSSNSTLVFMGFDADRAQLITSLLIAGVAAAAATLASNRRGLATLAGLGSLAALFGHVFLEETRHALASTGVDGSFDLAGWLSTSVTLLVVGVIAGWAGAALAQALRPGLIGAGSDIRDAIRNRRLDSRLWLRPVTVAVVLILLVFSAPVFGDMVNYTPNSRMLHGGAPAMGLIPVEPSESPTPAYGLPSAGASQATLSPQPGASLLPSVSGSPAGGALSSGPPAQAARSVQPNQRPWLLWRPSGGGSVTTLNMPAPWTDGAATTDVSIYTPPGYDPNGSRHYPVLYEAPTAYSLWDSATNSKIALDTMIDRGTVPAMIVVFINSGNGPYGDTECADSFDGRDLMDTFISVTVVTYVDSHYRTIARADARAITGFSQGGYCAAILALRHPTVFGTSIPFSGYYRAGDADANAQAPFGGDPAALAAASPMIVAAELPAAERANLFFVVIAKPSEPFFGPEATGFEQLIAADGYPYVALNDKLGHGWDEVREEFMAALESWASRLVAVGVF